MGLFQGSAGEADSSPVLGFALDWAPPASGTISPVAVLYAFPDVDKWPANAGAYRAYVNRTWQGWTQQHCYPENSVNYNAISLQLLINVIPRLLGHPEDVTHPATVAMVERFAGLF